jgi:D-alanyl-D-alanine carboxypeptidase (penicillin-binding protein 5/6)
MVATMQKDTRRVFLALGGLATDKERVEETRKILDWSMTAFERKRLFEAGDSVGEASVYGGAVSHVQLVTADAVDVLVPANNPERLSAKVIYRWPLTMPVEVGKQAGTLKIWSGERLLREVPVETNANVRAGIACPPGPWTRCRNCCFSGSDEMTLPAVSRPDTIS